MKHCWYSAINKIEKSHGKYIQQINGCPAHNKHNVNTYENKIPFNWIHDFAFVNIRRSRIVGRKFHYSYYDCKFSKQCAFWKPLK